MIITRKKGTNIHNACSCHRTYFVFCFSKQMDSVYKKKKKRRELNKNNSSNYAIGQVLILSMKWMKQKWVAMLYIEFHMQIWDGSDGSRAQFLPPDSIVNGLCVLFFSFLMRTRMRLRKSRSFTGFIFLFFIHTVSDRRVWMYCSITNFRYYFFATISFSFTIYTTYDRCLAA